LPFQNLIPKIKPKHTKLN